MDVGAIQVISLSLFHTCTHHTHTHTHTHTQQCTKVNIALVRGNKNAVVAKYTSHLLANCAGYNEKVYASRSNYYHAYIIHYVHVCV